MRSVVSPCNFDKQFDNNVTKYLVKIICHVMFSASSIIVYTVIVLLVQNVDSINLNNVIDLHRSHVENPLNIAFLQSKPHTIEKIVSNKNDIYNSGLLMENSDKKRDTEQRSIDPTLNQLKHVLSKLLQTKDKVVKKRELSADTGQSVQISKHFKRNVNKRKSKWNKWTDWSTCSVSCGKGREIRWRHCRDNCNGIETEMEEKACQLPSCPRSLFGIIKL